MKINTNPITVTGLLEEADAILAQLDAADYDGGLAEARAKRTAQRRRAERQERRAAAEAARAAAIAADLAELAYAELPEPYSTGGPWCECNGGAPCADCAEALALADAEEVLA